MKKLILGIAIAVISVAANAKSSDSETHVQPNQHLDVAKVITLTDTADACGIVPVQMVYVDHQGQRHTLDYEAIGNGCLGG